MKAKYRCGNESRTFAAQAKYIIVGAYGVLSEHTTLRDAQIALEAAQLRYARFFTDLHPSLWRKVNVTVH
jgi:hypothetical protein